MRVYKGYKRFMNGSKNVEFFFVYNCGYWRVAAAIRRRQTSLYVVYETAEFITHTDLLIGPSFKPVCLQTDVQKNRLLWVNGLFPI